MTSSKQAVILYFSAESFSCGSSLRSYLECNGLQYNLATTLAKESQGQKYIVLLDVDNHNDANC